MLQPQHFQQAWLRQDALFQRHLSCLLPHGYGVVRLEWDQQGLARGELLASVLEAILPDGVRVACGEDQPLQLDLTDISDFEAQKTVRIWLCVPHYRPGCAHPEREGSRWTQGPSTDCPDENTGESPEMVIRLRPAARLRAGAHPPSGVCAMPLARVSRLDGIWRMDTFMPPAPVLSDAAPGCKLLRERFDALTMTLAAAAVRAAGGTATGVLTAAAVLLPRLSGLRGLLQSRAAPVDLYRALCDLAGAVCSLTAPVVDPAIPAYDHDDVLACFEPLLRTVESRLEQLAPPHVPVPFAPTLSGFRLATAAVAIGGEVVLALRPRFGQSVEGCEEWMRQAIIGPERLVESLHLRRMTGASRRMLPREEWNRFGTGAGAALFGVTAEDMALLLAPGLSVVNRVAGPDLRPDTLSLIAPRDALSGGVPA